MSRIQVLMQNILEAVRQNKTADVIFTSLTDLGYTVDEIREAARQVAVKAGIMEVSGD